MNIALVGTGRMGRAVVAEAERRGHAVVARFSSQNPFLDADDPDALCGADVCVDFSQPELALDHLHRYAFWGVDAVVGTTGWGDDRDKVRAWMDEAGTAAVYAPNFSLGVALLVRALRGALPLLDRLDDFDPFVHETHHTAKLDSPSGTARLLGEELLAGLARKTRLETETQHGAIGPSALHVTSARAGHVFGEHEVGIDGPHDRIALTHVAKGREGFAAGAVRAAEWLAAQPRTGLFSLDDVIDNWATTSGDQRIGGSGDRVRP